MSQAKASKKSKEKKPKEKKEKKVKEKDLDALTLLDVTEPIHFYLTHID